MLHHVEAVLEFDYPWPSPTIRMIAIQAAYEADRKGIVRVSQTEIAGLLGCDRSVVSRAFKTLEGEMLLVREGHGRWILCEEWQPERERPRTEWRRTWRRKKRQGAEPEQQEGEHNESEV